MSEVSSPRFVSKHARSYQYSKSTVKDELRKHQDIRFLFDLHRDAEGRDKTTVQFENVNYAQVYFVVGTVNPDWEQNLKFAELIHEKLNVHVPELSKGIYLKDKTSGNGEYNQSLSGSSALIEVGGVENTLAESYRTIDVLAKVIYEITPGYGPLNTARCESLACPLYQLMGKYRFSLCKCT